MDEKTYIEIIKKVLESIDEGIHFVDTNFNTIIYNDTMARLEEMNKEDVIGKSFTNISQKMEIKNSTLLSVLKNKIPIKENIQKYLNQRGKEITTINTTIPIIIEEQLIGALEISKDVTQLQCLQDRIEKLEEMKFIKESKKYKLGYNFNDIIGESKCIKKAIDISKKASKCNAPVLIYGETGTGKELISQSIHYSSKRYDKSFIAQNCAALPETLLEGILFGTVRGGFTGAVDRPGLFEQANNGTLLLDEINSMPLQLQAKLLRVLQEGYVRRVGGTKDIPIDVRIIATTNENPIDIIDKGKLREDLYYRLNVIQVHIPPLRQREGDILLLANKFIKKYNIKLSKNIEGLSLKCENLLKEHYWKGNVRELENTIYSTMTMMEDEKIITDSMINLNTYRNEEEKMYKIDIESKPLDWIVADIEEKYISEALDKCSDNITKAAAILGIGRQNLQYKMRKYNIRRK